MTSSTPSGRDHVSRYCKASAIDESGMPMLAAFKLRTSINEQYLSVNWLEILNATNVNAALREVQRVLVGKKLDIESKGRFAILSVGTITTLIQDTCNITLQVRYIPTKKDESHSGIFGYKRENKKVARKIAEHLEPQDIYKIWSGSH